MCKEALIVHRDALAAPGLGTANPGGGEAHAVKDHVHRLVRPH